MRSAYFTSSARFWMPSFSMMWARWLSTVRTEMNSSEAISGLLSLRSTADRIALSRVVSGCAGTVPIL